MVRRVFLLFVLGFAHIAFSQVSEFPIELEKKLIREALVSAYEDYMSRNDMSSILIASLPYFDKSYVAVVTWRFESETYALWQDSAKVIILASDPRSAQLTYKEAFNFDYSLSGILFNGPVELRNYFYNVMSPTSSTLIDERNFIRKKFLQAREKDSFVLQPKKSAHCETVFNNPEQLSFRFD